MTWFILQRSPYSGVPKFNDKMEMRISRGAHQAFADGYIKSTSSSGKRINIPKYDASTFGAADPDLVAKLQELDELPLVADARANARANARTFREELLEMVAQQDAPSKSARPDSARIHSLTRRVARFENGMAVTVTDKGAAACKTTKTCRSSHVCQYPQCREVGPFSSDRPGTFATNTQNQPDPRGYYGWLRARCGKHQRQATPEKRQRQMKLT